MDVTDARQEDRYTVTNRLEGTLAGNDVILVDIGIHGAQLKHPVPIKLGTVGKLQIKVSPADGDLRVEGHVVWSKLAPKASPTGERPYHSGIRIEDPEGQLPPTIERMLELSMIKLDKDSIEKKRKMIEARTKSKGQPGVKLFGAKAPRIPDDVILLVKQTQLRLRSNPAENVKWLNRAKYSLDEAGLQIQQRDDVLAVWEYLERSIELEIIGRVLDQG